MLQSSYEQYKIKMHKTVQSKIIKTRRLKIVTEHGTSIKIGTINLVPKCAQIVLN